MSIEESIAEINKGLYPSRLTKEGEEAIRQRMIAEELAFAELLEKNKSIKIETPTVFRGAPIVTDNGDRYCAERIYRGY